MADARPLALHTGGQDFALEEGRTIVIGSAAACDLRLTEPGIGARHASITVSAGVAEVQDLGGGVLWNGQPAQRQRLHAGDLLRLGEVRLQVVADRGASRILPLPAPAHAAVDAAPRVPGTPGGLRRFQEPAFAELMADELRRAPWFSLSVVLHGLLLLLLWWLLQPPPEGGSAPVRLGFEVDDARVVTRPPDAAAAETVTPEVAEPERLPEPATEETLSIFSRDFAAETPLPSERPDLARLGRQVVVRRGEPGSGAGADPAPGPAPAGSPEFRRTVGQLRQSGLEVVFVLDSTGSMGTTIASAREHLLLMLDVLRSLIPDARFGFVVYRDRRREDDYVTRVLPLGTDFWRLCNFASTVEAGGGGDRPEAVADGLEAAFRQNWTRGARRVVVLAGDAPPHRNSEAELLRATRAFTSNARSSVHAIVTERTGLVGRDGRSDVQAAFGRIAEAGRGLCSDLGERSRILDQVLLLAFGHEFAGDLEAITAHIARQRERTDPRALDLVRRGGDALRDALDENPVRTELVQALAQRLRRDVARQVIGWLGEGGLTDHGRHAAAYALQRALELPQPPVDPVAGRPLSPNQIAALTEQVQRLPE